jgi:hypothetical protein
VRLRRREEKKLRVVLNSGMEKRRRRKGPNSEKEMEGAKKKVRGP